MACRDKHQVPEAHGRRVRSLYLVGDEIGS
jgi:hypothetical protein